MDGRGVNLSWRFVRSMGVHPLVDCCAGPCYTQLRFDLKEKNSTADTAHLFWDKCCQPAYLWRRLIVNLKQPLTGLSCLLCNLAWVSTSFKNAAEGELWWVNVRMLKKWDRERESWHKLKRNRVSISESIWENEFILCVCLTLCTMCTMWACEFCVCLSV